VAKAYFWHRFFSHQPDLNFDNPDVLREVLDIMRFWLDQGVDGLRLDAIPYLIEREGTNCENLPETHEIIRQIRRAMDEQYAGRMILAEANQWPIDVLPYFGAGDECHMAFHFPLMPRLFMALRLEDRHPITDIMAQTPDIPDGCQWGLFLRNHDELTLEMVSDEERDYMYLAYSTDPRMRLNVGIRRRLAPLVDNNRRRIELLKSILYSFPGTPIMYYGDEIGMGDNIYLGDRNGVRTPMQWSSDRNAGFSRAVPSKLYSPVVMDPIYGYESINVEAQLADPSSLLHWTRNMIGLRKLFKVFGRGQVEFLRSANRKILAYLRTTETEKLLCVANLSRFAQPAELDLSRFAGMTPVEMLGYVEFPRIGRTPYPLTLGPYGYLWFEFQTTAPVEVESGGEPALAYSGWSEMLTSTARGPLERLLPDFLARQRWFAKKSRQIDGVSVRDWTELPSLDTALLLVDLHYDSSSELYLVPLVRVAPERVRDLREAYPDALLATCRGATGVIFDATVDESFCRWLVHLAGFGESVRFTGGTLHGIPGQFGIPLRPLLDTLPLVRARFEQSNTSILCGDQLILKLFRRPTAGPNPDCEMTRYLSEQRGYTHVPRFAGALEYEPREGESITLGLLQELVPNQGSGWTWTQDELRRFYEARAVGQPGPELLDLSRRSVLTLAETAFPVAATEAIGPYLDAAAVLGRRVAELHLALATPTDDPSFQPLPLTRADLAATAVRMRDRAVQLLDRLKSRLSLYPDDVVELSGLLLARRRHVMEALRRLEELDPALLRTRIHGDLHLGQVLLQGPDFVILDFEGEPDRPPHERRALESPMKDVAGMLRSFSYAAQAALREHVDRRPQDADMLTAWARLWERAVSATFLSSYRETAAGAAFLPTERAVLVTLLDAFLVDKAFYELAYELDNRPAWARIPLLGILTLLRDPAAEH
jgi:maltose alpha-D-glucosyltransferase/alpha-amylase